MLYPLLLRIKKIVELNAVLFTAILGLIGCFIWANNENWNEMEPIIGFATSGIMVIANFTFKRIELYDNTQKVVAEHYCQKPAFQVSDNGKCRILIANFINDKTQQVALELTARYTQIKFTDLPDLHIRYCQNYDIYASNALKFKDENFCELLFFGDVKDSTEQKNYIRLNYIIDKRIGNYAIEEKNVSEQYHEYTPNIITQGVITATYDFFVYFIAGITLFRKNEYQKAIPLFIKAAQYSENHEVYSFLGDCYYYLKDFDRANEELDKSLQLKPDYAPALITKAEVIFRQDNKNIDNAINLLERAIKADPNNFNAHNNLALKYWHQHNVEQTLLHLNKSIAIQPNANAYSNRGTFYNLAFRNSQEHLKLSIDDFIKCLELSGPDYYYPYYKLAKNYLLLHENELALAHAKTYMEKTGVGDTEMYVVKAMALISLNRDLQQAEDAAYLAYSNVTSNKNIPAEIGKVAFYALVTALTKNANDIIIKKNEPLAFNKATIAYDMIKNLPVAEIAVSYRETIGLYATLMYNRGHKAFALDLLLQIEPHLAPGDIYQPKLAQLKHIFSTMMNNPNFYLQLTA